MAVSVTLKLSGSPGTQTPSTLLVRDGWPEVQASSRCLYTLQNKFTIRLKLSQDSDHPHILSCLVMLHSWMKNRINHLKPHSCSDWPAGSSSFESVLSQRPLWILCRHERTGWESSCPETRLYSLSLLLVNLSYSFLSGKVKTWDPYSLISLIRPLNLVIFVLCLQYFHRSRMICFSKAHAVTINLYKSSFKLKTEWVIFEAPWYICPQICALSDLLQDTHSRGQL